MITYGYVFCDLCGNHLGRIWNESAAASDLLPAPDYNVCPDCVPLTQTACPQPFAEQKEGGRG